MDLISGPVDRHRRHTREDRPLSGARLQRSQSRIHRSRSARSHTWSATPSQPPFSAPSGAGRAPRRKPTVNVCACPS